MRRKLPPSAWASVLHGQRLGEPGHALEQHVAAGQQADEQALEHRVLADDDALDLVQRLFEGGARLLARAECGLVASIGHGFLGYLSCLDQAAEPAQGHAAPSEQQHQSSAGEPGRDLVLLLLVPELRAELLVDVA